MVVEEKIGHRGILQVGCETTDWDGLGSSSNSSSNSSQYLDCLLYNETMDAIDHSTELQVFHFYFRRISQLIHLLDQKVL
jgi:hypothetical protein